MRIPTYMVLSLGAFTMACSSVSESNYNPMNWGTSEEVAHTLAPEEGYLTISDFRELVVEVTNLSVVNTNGGVIVHATGLPATQGYHSADLVPVNDEKPVNGTLTYEFRLVDPFADRRVSSQVSREVVVAHFISDAKLKQAKEIKVLGATNSRSSRAR